MREQLANFLRQDQGAVSADFVVLTACVIGLALLIIVPLTSESVRWGEAIADVAERGLNR